jgi:catechol 2,3-dioxygenase-like lactoylglutathione lyase family enzyme
MSCGKLDSRQDIDKHQYLPEVAMSRVQLALNVNDIDEAVSFYTALFGTEPAKRRPGYANFAVAEPPLKLVLLENPGQGGTLNHLGVEVDSADTVDAEQARLARAGLAAVDERDTTCCYARQDKFWVTGSPGGERWEIYTVLEDSATFWGQDSEQRWDDAQAGLDGAPAGPATPCCGGPQAASQDEAASTSTRCG